MEVQLEKVIAKLKNEGVEAAQKEAQQIIDEAHTKAQQVLQDAERQAKRIRQHGEEDAARFVQSGTESVRHAARDLVLLVKQEIETIFVKLLEEDVSAAMTGDRLSSCITNFVSHWHPDQALAVDLPPAEAEALSATLVKQLQQKVSVKNIEVRPFPSLAVGFRVSTQQGAVVLDFSQQEITTLLSRLLNPRFAALLN